MDNASIHHADVLQPFRNKINILFGPPYSPPLNPIEEIFGVWKHHLRYEIFLNEYELMQKVCETSKKITPNKIRKAVIRSLTFFYKALLLEDI